MTSASEQKELKKTLNELLKKPENRFCADCPRRSPRWASATLGIFICYQPCAAIHRSLGAHISFVQSVDMDTWKAEYVQNCVEMGNGRAKEIYEYSAPKDYVPPDEQCPELKKWIKRKYEYKDFIKPGYEKSVTIKSRRSKTGKKSSKRSKTKKRSTTTKATTKSAVPAASQQAQAIQPPPQMRAQPQLLQTAPATNQAPVTGSLLGFGEDMLHNDWPATSTTASTQQPASNTAPSMGTPAANNTAGGINFSGFVSGGQTAGGNNTQQAQQGFFGGFQGSSATTGAAAPAQGGSFFGQPVGASTPQQSHVSNGNGVMNGNQTKQSAPSTSANQQILDLYKIHTPQPQRNPHPGYGQGYVMNGQGHNMYGNNTHAGGYGQQRMQQQNTQAFYGNNQQMHKQQQFGMQSGYGVQQQGVQQRQPMYNNAQQQNNQNNAFGAWQM